MKVRRYARKFKDLSGSVGITDAAILLFFHLIRKAFPVAGTSFGKPRLIVRSRRCSQPICLRLGTSDMNVFQQIFIDEEYAPCSTLKNVGTIVDCGANIGLTSMYLLDRYPSASVLAIEPDPDNAAICRLNLSQFGGRARVECTGIWPTGDWDTPARLKFDRNAGDRREWAIAVREARGSENADCSGVAMSAVCDRVGRIDLLKVDIEGTEALIFSDESTRWMSRVGNIAIELHNETCRQAFSGALTQFTFELSKVRESVFARNIRPKTPDYGISQLLQTTGK